MLYVLEDKILFTNRLRHRTRQIKVLVAHRSNLILTYDTVVVVGFSHMRATNWPSDIRRFLGKRRVSPAITGLLGSRAEALCFALLIFSSLL